MKNKDKILQLELRKKILESRTKDNGAIVKKIERKIKNLKKELI